MLWGVSGTTGGFVLPDAVAPPPARVPAPHFAICLDKDNAQDNDAPVALAGPLFPNVF